MTSFLLIASALAGNSYYVLDTFDAGDEVAVQGGFVEGECWGTLYEPDPEEYPLTPLYVDLLFAGSSLQETVVVQIYYPDSNKPPWGPRVGEEAYALTGSDEYFARLDFEEAEIYLDPLTEGNVFVEVCFEEGHYEYPSIAADADGLDFRKNHYIYADFTGGGGDHYTTETVNGLLGGNIGDWIMRLCVETDHDSGEPCPSSAGSVDGDADTDVDSDTDTDTDSDSDSDSFSIMSITPNAAAEGESVNVVVLGTGFTDGAEARIGGIPLIGASLSGDTTISGLSPSTLPSGAHHVEVINGDGTSVVLPEGFTVGGGCGCASSPGAGGLAGLLGLIGLAALRRRR